MQFVEELFVAKDPYTMIDNAKDFLADFNNNKIKDEVISNTHFNSLFGEAEVDTSIDEAEDVDFESSNDGTQSELVDNLDDLENSLRDK